MKVRAVTINESVSFMDHPVYPQKSSLPLSENRRPSDFHETPIPDQATLGSQASVPVKIPLQSDGDENLYFLKSAALLNSPSIWEQDRAARFNLPELNASFYESVPALEFLQWEILEIKRGYAETVLPLNISSSNQYVAHQAALQLLAADYTGGLALASLFHLAPVLGFWESTDGRGIYLWGGAATIKWLAPSCDDLFCRASVPIEDWEKYIRRLHNHQKIVVTLQVDLYNGALRVAEVQFTYWAQDVEGMRRNAEDSQKINLLYLHKLKTTAKLIAGLRALETEKSPEQRICTDYYAKPLAGKHGITLARRFNNIIPELQCMVAARTKHLDQTAQDFLKRNPTGNIVSIGAGYDARFWRLGCSDQCRIYELDLPAMLEERKKFLRYDLKRNVHCIPIDLRHTTILNALGTDPSFKIEAPTLCIWEGGTMYFDAKDGEIIYDSLAKITGQCSESRLWIDYVSMDVVCGRSNSIAVNRFIKTMQKMGDPFIGGIEDIAQFANNHQMAVVENFDHAAYLGVKDNFEKQYCFATLKRNESYYTGQ